jgi:imidazolonepropionase-like amidohydrolase
MKAYQRLCCAILFVTILATTVSGQTNRRRNTAEHLFFKCKLLINPSSGATIANAIIETWGGKIMNVGKPNEVPIPPDAKVMDFSDKYVIPGLVDTHGHLYSWTGKSVTTTNSLLPVFYLANGVTTVGDPGSMDPGGDIALRNRIDAGQASGPRYFLAGEYIDMPPGMVGWMNPVNTAEEARLRVDMWAAQGTSAIKIYASAHGDVMQAAIDEAHEHSMRVWAHLGAVTVQQAIDMGVDQIFHGVGAMSDTRPPGVTQSDYAEWAKGTEALDLARPEIQTMLKAAARKKVVLTPTMAVSEGGEPGDYDKHHLEEQKRFYTPAAWEQIQKYIRAPIPPEFAAMAGELKKNKEFIRRAYKAGCLLSTGTDYVLLTMLPGWSLWREMEIFSEAGLPPMEILKAATWNGIYAIGRTDQLGSIETGKLADFVVLNANPLENISNVRQVHRVVKGGVVYDRDQLLNRLAGLVN